MRMKKQTLLEQAKFSLHMENSEDDLGLSKFGRFTIGLTHDEIKDYLRVRANQSGVERLYKKFCKIAGVNTMGMYTCPKCGDHRSLMYRHDVKRFADVMFLGIPTYWD